jgi:hypothetical protein
VLLSVRCFTRADAELADAQSEERETTMSEDTPRRSAQIIRFPEGGRAALASRRGPALRPLDLVPARAANVSCGAWYHEDAIRDAEKPRR